MTRVGQFGYVATLACVLIAATAGAWSITNAGFETDPVNTGWTHNGSGLSDSSTVCGPSGGNAYKDNAGNIQTVGNWIGWQGGCSTGVNAVISQAVAGLSTSTAYDIQAGAVGCTNLDSGISWNVQLRAANGDVTGSVTTANAGSTGTLIEGKTSVPGGGAPAGGWEIFGDGGSDNFTPGNTTVTLILWGRVSGSGWDEGSGIHWDGVTINGVTPVEDWTLY